MSDLAQFEQMLGQVQANAEKSFKDGSSGNRWNPPAGKYPFQGKTPKCALKTVNGEQHMLIFLPCEVIDGENNGKVYEHCVNSAYAVSLNIGKAIVAKMSGSYPSDFGELGRALIEGWENTAGTMEIKYRDGVDYPDAYFEALVDTRVSA